jgi:hypothetical protein
VQFESPIPLAGLSQLILPHRSLVAELDAEALAPALGRDTASPPSTLAMGTALLDLVVLAGRRDRVLIVVDDAQVDQRAPCVAQAETGRRCGRSGHPQNLRSVRRSIQCRCAAALP